MQSLQAYTAVVAVDGVRKRYVSFVKETISASEGDSEGGELGAHDLSATWLASCSSPVVRRYVRTGRMACFVSSFLLVVVSTVSTIRKRRKALYSRGRTPPQGRPTLQEGRGWRMGLA